MTQPASSMTFARIREYFLRTVGQSESAAQEAWEHITEGYREVLRQGDFPEVFREELRLTVPLDPEHPGEWLDYVELPCDYMTIYSLINETVGAPINFEPNGQRGRDRFLQKADPPDTRSKPPAGEVRWFVPVGRRIYLRDTPSEDTVIRITYRVQPPVLDDSNANEHPLTPPQADYAIVWFGAANYLKVHTSIENAATMAESLERQAKEKIHQRYNPDQEVEHTANHRMRVAGYRYAPRTMRRRR